MTGHDEGMSFPPSPPCISCRHGIASIVIEGAWLCPGCAELVERSSLADLMRYGASFQRRRLDAMDAERAAARAACDAMLASGRAPGLTPALAAGQERKTLGVR